MKIRRRPTPSGNCADAVQAQIATGRPFTVTDLAYRTGFSEAAVQSALASLSNRKIVRAVSANKKARGEPTVWEQRV